MGSLSNLGRFALNATKFKDRELIDFIRIEHLDKPNGTVEVNSSGQTVTIPGVAILNTQSGKIEPKYLGDGNRDGITFLRSDGVWANPSTSSSGLQGTQGLQGSNGIQGPFGYGSQGIQGIQGTQGNGIQGVQGNLGIQGMQGVQGNHGMQGMQGMQGNGIQGAQGIAGAAASQGTQGIQGFNGAQGVQGITGTGTQGVQGVQGRQGITGANGTQGATGIQGITGTGTQGVQGRQGITGTGTQGIQGFQGISGASANLSLSQINTGTITLTGAITGTASFNGTNSLTITTAEGTMGVKSIQKGYIYTVYTGTSYKIAFNNVNNSKSILHLYPVTLSNDGSLQEGALRPFAFGFYGDPQTPTERIPVNSIYLDTNGIVFAVSSPATHLLIAGYWEVIEYY